MSDNMIPATPDIPEFPDETLVEDSIPSGTPGASPTGRDGTKDWMAIVSLVCGVLSLCGLFFAPVGCIFSVASIVLGVLGLKSNQRTLAIIGLIIGGIGVLISIVTGIIWVLALLGPSIGNVFSEIVTDLESGY